MAHDTMLVWLPALTVLVCGAVVALWCMKVSSSEAPSKHASLRGFLWGVLCTAGVGVLWAQLNQHAVVREEPAQNNPAQASSQMADTALQELQDRITRNPNDLEALQQLSHRLLKSTMLSEAKVVNDRALKTAPQDPESLVHAAVIQVGLGDPTGGMKALDNVLKEHSTFAEGWFFKGMLNMQSGNQEGMRLAFEKFVQHAPDGPQKERIRAMLEGGAIPAAPHP